MEKLQLKVQNANYLLEKKDKLLENSKIRESKLK
jgi:hypothetical protein